jgi:tetratricopeptide (TPR) repeat protein
MCYYKLGLFQEAIRQHQKALALSNMDEIVLHLNKCYLRMDQPLIAVKLFSDLVRDTPGMPPQHPPNDSLFQEIGWRWHQPYLMMSKGPTLKA